MRVANNRDVIDGLTFSCFDEDLFVSRDPGRMQTATSIKASNAKAMADQSPQRRPSRRASAPDAAVAAAITAPTAAHPRALPSSVAVLKTPEARPRSSSPTPSVAAIVRGTLAV